MPETDHYCDKNKLKYPIFELTLGWGLDIDGVVVEINGCPFCGLILE